MIADDEEIRRASLRLLEPYTIPEECPYLSEDQRELSQLTFQQRGEWMAEWLALSAGTIDEEDEEEYENPNKGNAGCSSSI